MAFTLPDTADGAAHLIATGFRSILIPVNTAQPELPCDMLDVAAYLATERRSSIVLLAFTEIPLWEEVDVELPGLERHVEAMARQARAIAARRGVGVAVTAPRTRRPADLILREAQRRKAQLIVLGATGPARTSHGTLAHDAVTRRISDQASVPTMFIRAPVAA
ncbi:MAG TPA: universal stress protein [Gaiellales bacterium]|jgi:nucleotide-binding universal stress UspA family protein|nr:universal stress protein [Gaiellales bacterium]